MRVKAEEGFGWVKCLSCGKDSFKSVSRDQKRILLSDSLVRSSPELMVSVTRFYECLYCHSVMQVGPLAVVLAVRVNPPKPKEKKKNRVRRQWSYTSDERVYKRMKKVLND
jgi:hypothetical protein